MSKNYISRKNKKEKKEETYRKGEVITMLESMDDGIRLIAETQSETNKKLERVEKDVQGLKSDMTEVKSRLTLVEQKVGGLEQKFGGLEQKVGGLEQKVGGLEQKFGGLEQKFDRMQDDITEIKHKLSDKVDRSEFQRLEKRVIKLERVYYVK